MDVLTTAWAAAGTADPTDLPVGVCARCGSRGPLQPTFSVISRTFTAFDGWVQPGGPGLCLSCAWGYDTAELRATPHLVTRAAGIRALTRRQVQSLLTAGPLSPEMALAVPLRPGRKHVLPLATWGQIATDDATIAWSTQDSLLLGVVMDLRAHGFGSRMLTEPAPPFSQLRRCHRSQWPQIMNDWTRLTPWRSPCNPWLALSLHITSPEKERSC